MKEDALNRALERAVGAVRILTGRKRNDGDVDVIRRLNRRHDDLERESRETKGKLNKREREKIKREGGDPRGDKQATGELNKAKTQARNRRTGKHLKVLEK